MNTLKLRIEHEKRGKSIHWIEELSVDGIVLNIDYALDYHELARSISASGEYWPFTCSCGEPGCAGISSPIEVRHVDCNIVWHIVDPQPERRFTFDAEQYQEMIASTLERAGKLVMQRQRDLPFGPFGFDRDRLKACLALCR